MHKETGCIGTTGPEMRRFFFTVDDAVKLVLTAMEHIEETAGKVLSRKMKAAQIKEILDIWIEDKGGRWEQIEGRPGERLDEYLIGDLELPHTREIEYHGITHYLISFNEKVANPVAFGLSSANTDRLEDQEIRHLINSVPVEEQSHE